MLSANVRSMSAFVTILSPLKRWGTGPGILSRIVFLSQSVPFAPEVRLSLRKLPGKTPETANPTRYNPTRYMVSGRCRSWKGASVRVCQNYHNAVAHNAVALAGPFSRLIPLTSWTSPRGSRSSGLGALSPEAGQGEISIPMGQWSDPITSGMMKALQTRSSRPELTKK